MCEISVVVITQNQQMHCLIYVEVILVPFFKIAVAAVSRHPRLEEQLCDIAHGNTMIMRNLIAVVSLLKEDLTLPSDHNA